MSTISVAELAKHNSRGDCWVAIHGRVYNLTTFLDAHPAGAGIILKHAGTDATSAFDPFHPSDMIERMGLEKSLFVGLLEVSSTRSEAPEVVEVAAPPSDRPALHAILNAHEFEAVAKKVMKPTAWDYYSSGADDEITLRENRLAFHRVWLRPRVLVNVAAVDSTTSVLGYPSSFPVLVFQ
jgi:L-lactate dehydrogenase (cytochrome)